MDDLLSIGRFARMCGLSVGALRHHDELGLLEPARVDRQTGYRSYRRGQVETARLIVRLRDLEVPLPEIRALLGAGPAERRRRLIAHRARLEARTWHLHGALHHLDQLTRTEDRPMTGPTPTTDTGMHRRLAVDLFNHVWTLLETTDRTSAEDDEMLHAAHASRYHWSRTGEEAEPYRLAVGEWQCSRVYSVLGRAEPALHHARRCLEICDSDTVPDWVRASALEAMARASGVAGDVAAAKRFAAQAREAAEGIAEEDDREVVLNDLATLST